MKLEKMFGHRKKGMAEANEKKVSLRFLLSYLFIMAAPSIAIVVIYFATSNALLDVQKEKTYRLLSEAVITFDQQLEEIRNVGIYTSEQKELAEFLRSAENKSKQEQFYDLYMIAQSFPDYKLINKSVGDIYILMRDLDYVIRVPSVIPVNELGMLTLDNFEGSSYDEVLKQFCNDYPYGAFLNIEKKYGGGYYQDLAMVRSLPKTAQDNYESAVVVTYNETALKKLMQQSLLEESGMVLITNDQGMVIRCEGGDKETIKEIMGQSLSDLEKNGLISGSSMTYSIQSKYKGWTFTSVTPYSAMLGNIGMIKYLIIILCVASIAIGFCICLTYWYRRKSTVKRYLIFNEEMGDGKAVSFWGSFNDFMEKVEDLQTTVTRQQMIVRKETLRNLLYGNYDSNEEIQADLGEESGTFNTARGYYVVVLEYEDPLKNNLYASKKEFQEEVEHYLADQFRRVHWLYEISQLSYAIIVADDGSLTSAKLKTEFEKLNYYFYREKPLQIFTGISSPIIEMMQVSSAYEEATNICEYAQMLGIRVPLLRNDLPKDQETFVFPIDMEMQLEQMIRSGTEEEMENQIHVIREYYLNGLQDYSMLRHVLEILRCTIIRSLEKNKKEEEAHSILSRVKKAERTDEIFEEIRNANAYYQKGKKVTEDVNMSAVKQSLAACMEENYGDAGFNLAILSDAMDMNERRLYKDFKDYFGVTFSEYLEQLRIRNACIFLKEGMAVKDVAAKSGYGSDYSFRRAFKRVIGIPPSDFQKNQNQPPN